MDEKIETTSVEATLNSQTDSVIQTRNSSPAGNDNQEIFVVPPDLFDKKGRTLSVINQKGGCGKTTTAVNLAAGLAKEGFKVLLIDLDAQANATLGHGLRLGDDEKTVYDLFKHDSISPEEVIRATSTENVWLLPASRLLSDLAVELLEAKNWEYHLRSFVQPLKPNYHYILIDCPPALNALTVNALTASDEMIIPLQTHYFSLEGMKELFLTVHAVQEKLNPFLKNGLILPTLFDSRPKITREMLQSVRDYFKDQVFETVIHVNIRLVESLMHGQSVFSYDPRSRGAKDYEAFARELIKKDALVFTARIS